MSLNIVDMTGDGIWPEMSKEIRENLVDPYFDVKWHIHDISVPTRDQTNDSALQHAIADLKEHKAGVKGPTITPTTDQTAEMGLSQQLRSPNGIIRSAVEGAVIMRTPLTADNLPRNADNMYSVTTARQAVGGIYGAPNFEIPGNGTIKVIFEDEDGTEQVMASRPVDSGVAMITTESDEAIHNFARATLQQGISLNKSVAFASKSTILPAYDGRFIDIFNKVFEAEYKDAYEEASLEFRPDDLIDAVVSKIPQGKFNNWIIAVKNYDGDVMSDQVAGESLSLGMMDSTLVSADGTLLADPPHGTAPDLEKFWHEEGKLVANPTAHIFAYAEALRHKAELEGQSDVALQATALKQATLDTISNGHMTGDLAHYIGAKSLTGQEFIQEVVKTFDATLKHDMDFDHDPDHDQTNNGMHLH